MGLLHESIPEPTLGCWSPSPAWTVHVRALERALTSPELLICSDESLTLPPEELAHVNLSGAHTV